MDAVNLSTADEGLLKAKVKPEILESFDETQKAEVVRLLRSFAWKTHPLDIRLSIPLVVKSYYLTIIGGEEKRSKERLLSERKAHPLWTANNSIFLFWFTVIAFIIAGTILDFYAGALGNTFDKVPLGLSIYLPIMAVVSTISLAFVATSMTKRHKATGIPYNTKLLLVLGVLTLALWIGSSVPFWP